MPLSGSMEPEGSLPSDDGRFLPIVLCFCYDGSMQRRRKLQPGLQLALGFLLIIAVGAVLLYLPVSHQEGVDLPFLDALFVSVSAVCVTGLTPVDISATLSLFGSTVLMLLIQLGGLGYAVVAVIIIRLASGRIDVSTGKLLHDSLGADHRVGTRKLLLLALSVTGIAEALGAIMLFIPFSSRYPLGWAAYLAVFHSVSAFNNAGFDLFSDSLMKWNDDPAVLIAIASLIVLGGLGFILYGDILDHARHGRKVSIHSRIVLSTTAFLIISGTVLFRLILPDADWKNAFFQSVTTRTAGYFSYDQSTLPPAGIVLTVILMFIGASPGSTGGGVKTTSFYTAVKASFSLLLGRSPRAYKREISSESVMKAFFVIIISVLLVAGASFLLMITDPEFPADQILYETVSAYATVGLTMGITPYISSAGKIILIIMMYLGRVGFMTIISAFARRRLSGARYMEEKVIIG